MQLVVTPPIVSTATFILVLRMLAQLCSRCPTIAVKLLEQNIVGTLSSLLLRTTVAGTGGTDNPSDEVELVQRNPQELLEMMNLIAELLPKLPKDGIYVVNAMMANHPQIAATQDAVQWQWKDDRGTWTSYSPFDSRIIEVSWICFVFFCYCFCFACNQLLLLSRMMIKIKIMMTFIGLLKQLTAWR